MQGCLKWFGLMTAIAFGIVLALVIVVASCSYAVSTGVDRYNATRTAVAIQRQTTPIGQLP